MSHSLMSIIVKAGVFTAIILLDAMTKKHTTRQAAEAWVEARLVSDSYTKDTDRHLTVYISKSTRRVIARASLWSESVWMGRIN